MCILRHIELLTCNCTRTRTVKMSCAGKLEAQQARSGQEPSAKVRRLDNFVMKTTESENETTDELARFIFATNSPFRLVVGHEEFKKAVQFCTLVTLLQAILM